MAEPPLPAGQLIKIILYSIHRMPESEIIRDIINEADLPIAGPSANKFGRISPTNPRHVISAFAHDDISIIDDANRSLVRHKFSFDHMWIGWN